MDKVNIMGIELALPAGQEQNLTGVLCNMSNAASLPDMIRVDENGLICDFKPKEGTSMGDILYFQSLMINQRLQLMDDFLRDQGVIK